MSHVPPPFSQDPQTPPPETAERVPLVPPDFNPYQPPRSEEGFDPYRNSYGLSAIPVLTHHDTNATLVGGVNSPPEKSTKDLEKIDETPLPPSLPFPQPNYFSPPTPGHIPLDSQYIPPPPPPLVSRNRNDRLLFGGICVMILWPWAFFGAVSAIGGVQWTNGGAQYFVKNPGRITFIVTLIGSVIRFIAGLLFSFSVVRFGQEWVARNDPQVTVFDVSLLSAFRNQSWVWPLGEWKNIFEKPKLVPLLLVGMCMAGFTLVPSGTASLIAPTTFNKTAPLLGKELNFAPGDAGCLSWLEANQLQSNCDWKVYNGMQYTTCLSENQMGDVLESGRGSMLGLLNNNTGTSSFSQLGANDGLHFLGPLRGVLPIGPNGVPAFNNLVSTNNPFDDPYTLAGIQSYNYTLEHQGLGSAISCVYDTSSPIRFGAVPDSRTLVLQYNATCDPALGLQPILANVLTYNSVNGNNSMGYWACQSSSTVGSPSYSIFLRGRANYQNSMGNITCTVSPIQPETFYTTYNSLEGSFTAETVDAAISVSGSSGPAVGVNGTYYKLVQHGLVGLGNMIWEAQNWESNLVAEAVITFGVKSRGAPAYQKSDTYLRLYEAMIQGILEYEATYTRLLYTTIPNPPKTCIRDVNGVVSYAVIGWYAGPDQAGFLVPMTLINLASLVILLVAVIIGDGDSTDFDPTDTRPLLTAKLESGLAGRGQLTAVQWSDEVHYPQVKT